MPSELETRLRALYREPTPGQAEHQRMHEDALVAAVARRDAVGPALEAGSSSGASASRSRPTAHRSGPRCGRWFRLPRLALAGALGLAVAVGACVMPVEYPVRLGYGLDITVDASRLQGAVELEAIGEHLEGHPDVERVELLVARHRERRDGEAGGRDQLRLRLFVLGEDLDPDALMDELQARFPVLADAELHDVPLSGTVHGTLGGKLSHRLLDFSLDRHGVEEAEARILAQLVADGIAPERATIDITDEQGPDGERRIEVRVEAER